QVVEAEQRPLLARERPGQRLGVHARRRHVFAQAIDHEQRQREQDASLELRDLEDVAQLVEHQPLCLGFATANSTGLAAGSSTFPPADSIALIAAPLPASTPPVTAALSAPPATSLIRPWPRT